MIRIQRLDEVDDAFFEGQAAKGCEDAVRAVIDEVRRRGDDALKEYAQRFDGIECSAFEVAKEDVQAAKENMERENPALFTALCSSRGKVMSFAQWQKKGMADAEYEIDEGLVAGQRCIPVERAGVYVPAGRHPLVSTVVMTVVPALAAGVKEIVLCTPPRVHKDRTTRPYADENIMAAAAVCAGDEASRVRVFAAGGAQAIAAMAYGTQSIPACSVIAGPGNKFVAEAKRQVFGKAGIDMIAGPTEVLIIADSKANPKWVAADLLAQAEHDTVAQATLIVTDEAFAHLVAKEADNALQTLATRDVAEKSIEDNGRIIIASSFDEAARIANRKAPEHLEISMSQGAEREEVVSKVRNFGSLFIGGEAAEVLGDYSAGINHTLPTTGAARYTGGLSVKTFMKTVTTLRAKEHSKGLERAAQEAGVLADAEGLAGHARAARLRLGQEEKN